MPEFFERFDSVNQCEDRVSTWRWPDGFVCPRFERTGQGEFRPQVKPRLAVQGWLLAVVQTTEDGERVVVRLRKRSFIRESIQAFDEKSLAEPATLGCGGLGCFTAVRGSGVLRGPHVAHGGAARVGPPAFLAMNSALGKIETSLSGTYHAFAFKECGQRYLERIRYLSNHRFKLRHILLWLARDSIQVASLPLKTTRAGGASCASG